MNTKRRVVEVYGINLKTDTIYRRHYWYWRLRASNGKILADSGQGYRSKANAINIAKSVFGGAYEVKVL